MKITLIRAIKLLTVAALLLMISVHAASQSRTQLVSGTVIDRETQLPVLGATVYVKDSEPLIGTATDQFGKYKLENVPLGRVEVVCTSVGYSTYVSEALIITSAKEVSLDISLNLG